MTESASFATLKDVIQMKWEGKKREECWLDMIPKHHLKKEKNKKEKSSQFLNFLAVSVSL